ncbi:MAG: transporter substrate-binding domain-containing protein [Rhodoferax sp.]|nr:transporter substrate-binding domain-containing protein [Rhodoferax sp.]
MKSAARKLLGALALCLLPHFAWTAPLVLVTANYPPYCMEEDGKAKGVAVELVKEAFSRMHQDITIVFVPLPRAIEMVKSGQADAIFPFAMRQDRKQFFHYTTEKLLSDPGALFVRADSTINFDGDYAKLNSYSIGMQRGTYQGDAFMQAIQTYHLKIDEAVDQEQNVRKLVAKRFDIAVGPRLVVQDAARRVNEASAIRVLYADVSEGSAYVAFSTQVNRDALIAQLDLTFRKMRQDGSYRRIFGAVGGAK